MRALLRESRSFNGLIAVLLALVLVARLVAPAGYMPTATAQGVVVALCSGSEGHSIRLDLGRKAPAQKPAADAPCAFAVAPTLALDTDAPALSLATVMPEAQPMGAIADLTVHRLAAPPPPAQGPPAAA